MSKKKLPKLGYYSSKPTHKNQALWTKSRTITIGDPYSKKLKPASRIRSRQFQVGRREKDTFDDFKALSIFPTKGYKSDAYTKKNREHYRSVEGPDMTGFGSRNARNIAMDTMSTKRWSEKLHKEMSVHQKKAARDSWKAQLPELPVPARVSKSAPAGKEVFLYDRTHAADDETLKWKPKKGKDRRLGSTKPASLVYGSHVNDTTYKPSKWLRIHKCKEFYNDGSIDESTMGGGNDYYLNM